MYRDGLNQQLASRSLDFRFALSGLGLEGVLFGTQPCSHVLLCLQSQEWRLMILASKACHDFAAQQALATAMPLPFQV